MYKSEIIEKRIIEEAIYMINNKSTVRCTASKFGISKSTIHNDLVNKLNTISIVLFNKVKDILELNKKERAYRGGQATKAKYTNAQ